MLPVRNESDDSSERSETSPSGGPSMKDRFEEIALPHLDSVFRLARSLAGAEAEAEDLLQETLHSGVPGVSRIRAARLWR